ncbi:hypothetical protein [Actinomadura sp. WAC 06369]|uniref:hypothetical protein n=1 Tax=Actinomadura sp. WAC 06369 TaxID=2203193 RepID=UPI000F789736|nr:hypothetical protein [Actinomadura sp. WAC 06369]RSN48973.1 hypothetical protein DMH08_33005 [Actinomadura sp. WAC 06369]
MPAAVITDAVRTPLAKGKPGAAHADVHPVDRRAEVLSIDDIDAFEASGLADAATIERLDRR